jgi:hypothetical protein
MCSGKARASRRSPASFVTRYCRARYGPLRGYLAYVPGQCYEAPVEPRLARHRRHRRLAADLVDRGLISTVRADLMSHWSGGGRRRTSTADLPPVKTGYRPHPYKPYHECERQFRYGTGQQPHLALKL